MRPPMNQQASTTPIQEGFRATDAAFIGALAAWWLLVSWRLSFVWDSSDQYSHGWFVPLFAGWIFWNRWIERPVPRAPSPTGRVSSWLALGIALAGTFAAHLILESSPDWRMMMLLLSTAAFIASLALSELAGGGPWVRHFAFVFLFFLVAVPWPYDFETYVTMELSLLAARVTAALLNLGGILAICNGNTIELAAGVLGVEDACSGIRSFQSSLMVALLLGEWFGLRVLWRVILCLLGLLAAYALNVARMLALSLAVESTGVEAVARWHDPAGFVILFATLGLLWLGCLVICRLPASRSPRQPAPHPPGQTDFSGPSIIPAAAVVLVALVSIVGLTEGWYRHHERGRTALQPWVVAPLPPETQGSQEPLGENIQVGLGYDEGFRRVWKDASGHRWELIYLRWEPGRKSATAGPHAPDYCQAALGRTILSKSPIRTEEVNGIAIPYKIYELARGAEKFHLLFALDDGRRDLDWMRAGMMGEESSRAKRLDLVRHGRRNLGQVSLQLALLGMEDGARAEQEMLGTLSGLVREHR